MTKFTAFLVSILLFTESFLVPLAHAAVLPQMPMPQALAVPRSIGRVVDQFKGNSSRSVVHIQDVHESVDAQINLSAIIKNLHQEAAKTGKILVVAVEGSTGELDSDSISNLPNQSAKEEVGAGLLRAGYLFGEDYAAITEKAGEIKLIGVEVPSLYQKNGAAKNNSLSSREKILAALQSSQKQLNSLSSHAFNATLETLLKMRGQVNSGSLPLPEYLAFLKSVRPQIFSKYPRLVLMLSVSVAQKNMTRQGLEFETKKILADITSGSNVHTQELLSRAEDLRDGKLSPYAYYSDLIRRSKNPSIEMKAYVKYLGQMEAAEGDASFVEMDRAEDEIAQSLIGHSLSYQLYTHLLWNERMKNFFSLSLIPQEWAHLRNLTASDILSRQVKINNFIGVQYSDLGTQFTPGIMNGKDLSKAFDGAHGFYDAAELRDQAMTRNLAEILKKYPSDRALIAFIAGGFHTPGVTRSLRSMNISYDVVRPQLQTSLPLSDKYQYPHQTYRAPSTLATSAGVAAVVAAVKNPGSIPPSLGQSSSIKTGLSLIAFFTSMSSVFAQETAKQSQPLMLSAGGYVLAGILFAVLIFVGLARYKKNWIRSKSIESQQVIAALSADGTLSVDVLSNIQTYAAAKDMPLLFSDDYTGKGGVSQKFGHLIVNSGVLRKSSAYGNYPLKYIYPDIDGRTKSQYRDIVPDLFDAFGLEISAKEAERVYDWLTIKDEAKSRGVTPHELNSILLDDVYLSQLNAKIQDKQFQLEFTLMAEKKMSAFFGDGDIDPVKFFTDLQSQTALLVLLPTSFWDAEFSKKQEGAALVAQKKAIKEVLNHLMVDADFVKKLSTDPRLSHIWSSLVLPKLSPQVSSLARQVIENKPIGATLLKTMNRAILETAFSTGLKKTQTVFIDELFDWNPVNWTNFSIPHYREELVGTLGKRLENWLKEANNFENKDRAKYAQKVATLIGFMSGAPKELYSDKVDPYNPPKQEALLTKGQIIKARKDVPWMIYSGQIVNREFAGGNARRLGVNKPAALVTPRDAHAILVKTQPDLKLPDFPDLPVLGRYILQIKSSVTEIALENNWDIEAGLASQTIIIPTNEAFAPEIQKHLAEVNYYGMPRHVFVFLEQATGPGFDFKNGEFIRLEEPKGKPDIGGYGHGENEYRHNLPFEAYRIDSSGEKVILTAPYHRYLASQNGILSHTQLSLEDVFTPGWIHDIERLAIAVGSIRSGLAGTAEFRLDKTGSKGGMTGTSEDFPASVAKFFGKDRGVVTFEQSMLETTEGPAIREKHQSLTANSGIVVASARILETVVNAAKYPLIATLRGGKNEAPLYTVHPDTWSYWYFNLLNFQFFTPPHFRRELKEQTHFPLFMEDTTAQDNAASNQIYYAYGAQIQNVLVPGSAVDVPLPTSNPRKGGVVTGTSGYVSSILFALLATTVVATAGTGGAVLSSSAAPFLLLLILPFVRKSISRFFSGFSFAPAAASQSFFSSGFSLALGAEQNQLKETAVSAAGIINDSRYASPQNGFSAVAIDIASFVGSEEGAQFEEAVRVVLELHRQKESVGINSHLVFFNTDPNLSGIEEGLRRALSKVEGLSFNYVGAEKAANLKGNVGSLFAEVANATPQNSYVLSANEQSWTGAQYIPTYNLPHLSLAMFAYTHYPDAKGVLDRLVALFEKNFKIDMRNHNLTRDIQISILTKIAA